MSFFGVNELLFFRSYLKNEPSVVENSHPSFFEDQTHPLLKPQVDPNNQITDLPYCRDQLNPNNASGMASADGSDGILSSIDPRTLFHDAIHGCRSITFSNTVPFRSIAKHARSALCFPVSDDIRVLLQPEFSNVRDQHGYFPRLGMKLSRSQSRKKDSMETKQDSSQPQSSRKYHRMPIISDSYLQKIYEGIELLRSMSPHNFTDSLEAGLSYYSPSLHVHTDMNCSAVNLMATAPLGSDSLLSSHIHVDLDGSSPSIDSLHTVASMVTIPCTITAEHWMRTTPSEPIPPHSQSPSSVEPSYQPASPQTHHLRLAASTLFCDTLLLGAETSCSLGDINAAAPLAREDKELICHQADYALKVAYPFFFVEEEGSPSDTPSQLSSGEEQLQRPNSMGAPDSEVYAVYRSQGTTQIGALFPINPNVDVMLEGTYDGPNHDIGLSIASKVNIPRVGSLSMSLSRYSDSFYQIHSDPMSMGGGNSGDCRPLSALQTVRLSLDAPHLIDDIVLQTTLQYSLSKDAYPSIGFTLRYSPEFDI